MAVYETRERAFLLRHRPNESNWNTCASVFKTCYIEYWPIWLSRKFLNDAYRKNTNKHHNGINFIENWKIRKKKLRYFRYVLFAHITVVFRIKLIELVSTSGEISRISSSLSRLLIQMCTHRILDGKIGRKYYVFL